MPALPSTVAVDCPRCDGQIHLTLQMIPVPSDDPKRRSLEVEVKVLDLADRFAEHYREAGHT